MTKRDARATQVTVEADAMVVVVPSEPRDGGSPDRTAPPPDSTSTVAGDAAADPGTMADASAPGAGCDNAVACANFDDGVLPAGWTKAGSPTVDGTRARSGSKALLIKARQGNETVRIPLAGLAEPVLHGRLYMYLEGTAPSSHGTVIAARGKNSSDAEAAYRLGMSGGRYMGTFRTTSQELVVECHPKYNCPFEPSASNVPTGKWVCLEWAFNGKAGTPTQIFVDGRKLDQRAYNATWPTMKSFDQLELGFNMTHSVTPFSLWIDDVVLSGQRVGCAP